MLVRPPKMLYKKFPDVLWHMPRDGKKIYLTFDDGPTPVITPFVLEQLDEFNAKASFFCLGSQVEKHPELFSQIKERGHLVGNHSYSHPNGWNTLKKKYVADVEKASRIIDSPFFRPPYGKIKPSQVKALKGEYTIVMWDVLSGDFHSKIKPLQCLKNIKMYTKPGSVIVFHDTKKAEKNLRYTLARILKFYSKQGFEFCSLKHAHQ